MGHTFCVLTAGLLLGQFQDSAPPMFQTIPGWSTQTKTWTQTGTWTPTTGWTWQTVTGDGPTGNLGSAPRASAPAATPSTQINAGTPNIFTRLGDKVNSLFGPKVAPEQNVSHGQTAAVVSTMEPPLLETVEQPRGLPFTQPQPGRFESAAIEMVQIQDAPVVSTRQMILDGQVHKVGHNADYSGITGRLEIVNGAYFVHYAAPESGDRFNGRMILTGNLDLNLFRTADLVTIRGVVRPGRTVSLYEAHYVELLERMAP